MSDYTKGEAEGSVGPGWRALAGRAWELVTRAGGEVRYVVQKHGRLVVEFDGAEEAAVELEALAARSVETCEACGRPGVIWREPWVLTLCAPCAALVYVHGRGVWECGPP